MESNSLLTPGGLKERCAYTNNSAEYYLSSPLYTSLFMQKQALPSMLNMQIILDLNDDKKVIRSSVADEDFKYAVTSFKLVLIKLKCIESFT